MKTPIEVTTQSRVKLQEGKKAGEKRKLSDIQDESTG